MKIQISIDSFLIEYILENNLSKHVAPFIGLGEVLQWLANHPESLQEEEAVYRCSGDSDLFVLLESKMNREDDTYYVSVYEVVLTN